MYLGMDAMKLVDPVKLEKMVLAKRIGQFLGADHEDKERSVVEDVARVLAQDVSAQVREVLAFELRKCDQLAGDLAERIAKDIEDVASPFLATTKAFTDQQLADLIPALKEYARVTLARRSDLGAQAAGALVKFGEEKSVTYLVRNDNLDLTGSTYDRMVSRFGDNQRIMDHLSARADLPIEVVQMIASKVSEHCREALVLHYDVQEEVAEDVTTSSKLETLWHRIDGASPQQVHAYVTDLRGSKQLTLELAIEMAEKGSKAFLESTVALEAGLPLARVRATFSLEKPSDFVRLMQQANVTKAVAPRILNFVKSHYADQ